MLICDFCGCLRGKNKIDTLVLEFNMRRPNQEPKGIIYSQDVCENCYTKIYNMLYGYNQSLNLSGVLSQGLDLKPHVTRGVIEKEVADHYNR